ERSAGRVGRRSWRAGDGVHLVGRAPAVQVRDHEERVFGRRLGRAGRAVEVGRTGLSEYRCRGEGAGPRLRVVENQGDAALEGAARVVDVDRDRDPVLVEAEIREIDHVRAGRQVA